MSASSLTVELSIQGLDCPSCAAEVESALRSLPGVREASVLVAASRAIIRFEPDRVAQLRGGDAVAKAGYAATGSSVEAARPAATRLPGWGLFGTTAALVLGLSAVEHLGFLDPLLARFPAWLLGLLLAAAAIMPSTRSAWLVT